MERVRELRLERPNERQEVFLRDRHKYIAFGGARGGGKSWAGSSGAARNETCRSALQLGALSLGGGVHF